MFKDLGPESSEISLVRTVLSKPCKLEVISESMVKCPWSHKAGLRHSSLMWRSKSHYIRWGRALVFWTEIKRAITPFIKNIMWQNSWEWWEILMHSGHKWSFWDILCTGDSLHLFVRGVIYGNVQWNWNDNFPLSISILEQRKVPSGLISFQIFFSIENIHTFVGLWNAEK